MDSDIGFFPPCVVTTASYTHDTMPVQMGGGLECCLKKAVRHIQMRSGCVLTPGGGLQSSYGGTMLIVEMEDDTSFIFVRM